MPFLALLSGPFGRFALYAGLVVAMIGAGAWIVHEHDRRILAERAAEESAAVAATQIADMRKAVQAASDEARAATDRANATAIAKREIARAPVTVACAASPAIVSVLAGMRGPGGSGASAAGSPPGVAGMPAPTRSAQPVTR